MSANRYRARASTEEDLNMVCHQIVVASLLGVGNISIFGLESTERLSEDGFAVKYVLSTQTQSDLTLQALNFDLQPALHMFTFTLSSCAVNSLLVCSNALMLLSTVLSCS